MAVTGARKGFPPPTTKPPGWVNPPNTQPGDPITGPPHPVRPPKPFPVFPGAPIQPPPGAIVIDDGPDLKWPVGSVDRPLSFVSTEDAAKIEPNAPANDANNSMVAGRSTNTIHGEENNVLQGNKVDEREGENTARKGVETAHPIMEYGDTDGIVFPSFNCPGSQSYAALSLSGFPGGCGCWVSTGADLSAFFAAGLGPAAIKKIRGIGAGMIDEAGDVLRNSINNKKIRDSVAKALGSRRKMRQMMDNLENNINNGDWHNIAATLQQFGVGLQTFGPLVGLLLGATTVYRQKTCVGANAYLNTDTCACQCYPGYEDCDIPNGINFVGRAFGWYWDILELPIIDPDEIMGCVEGCNCQGTFIQDPAAWSGQICECECTVDPEAQSCPDGYTFDDSADVCCCVPFDDGSSFKECCDGTNIISIGTGSCAAEGYLDTCDVLGYGDQIVCDCHA